MFWYVLKLLILLPLIGAMIWGSLKLAKKTVSYTHLTLPTILRV